MIKSTADLTPQTHMSQCPAGPATLVLLKEGPPLPAPCRPRPVITQDTSIPPVCPLLSLLHQLPQAASEHQHSFLSLRSPHTQAQTHFCKLAAVNRDRHLPQILPIPNGHHSWSTAVPSTRLYPLTPSTAGAVSSLLASSCGCKKMFLLMIIPGNYTLSTS